MALKDMLADVSAVSVAKGGMVELGYGQVEPNHLSAQRTGQIYAQLPADTAYDKLEQGQFVKYDYANGLVKKTGAGEWMLVYNETKLYRDDQNDCEFAMIKGNYGAKVYSPYDADNAEQDIKMRDYSGIIAPEDIRELDYTDDPFHVLTSYKAKAMPEGTTMVPRVFKTNIGDIFTTNTVAAKFDEVTVGTTILAPNADGYLAVAGENATMKWQVVKKYNLPDGQKAVKVMRIA